MENIRLRFYAIVFFIVLCLPNISNAQFEDVLKHHVIVAIDMTMPGQTWPQKESTCDEVFKTCLTKEILRDGDYISFVGFSTDEKAKSFDDYTYILTDSVIGGLYYRVYDKSLNNQIYNRWESITSQKHRRHDGDKPFSMLSLAKLKAFAPLKKQTKEHYVNRTFVVIITDHQYNGGDLFEEGIALNGFNRLLTPKAIQDLGQCVSSEYFVKWLRGNSGKLYRSPFAEESRDINECVDLYEYIPLQSGLTLPTVIDYPAGVMAKRVRDGKYILKTDIISMNDPRYNLLRLHVRIEGNDTIFYDIIRHADTAQNDYVPINTFNVYYDFGNNPNIKGSMITIEAWISLNDSIYNATVLTPVKNAPDYLASRGLHATIPITFEEPAKILGMVPLPDYMMLDDDQAQVATVITVIAGLLLLFIAFIIARIIILWLQIHHITADDININKI